MTSRRCTAEGHPLSSCTAAAPVISEWLDRHRRRVALRPRPARHRCRRARCRRRRPRGPREQADRRWTPRQRRRCDRHVRRGRRHAPSPDDSTKSWASLAKSGRSTRALLKSIVESGAIAVVAPLALESRLSTDPEHQRRYRGGADRRGYRHRAIGLPHGRTRRPRQFRPSDRAPHSC